MEAFSWIWQYLRKYKLLLLIAAFMILVTTALSMVTPRISGIIVDKVILGKELDLLLPLVGLMIATIFIKAGIQYCFQLIFEHVSQNTIHNIRSKIYSQIHTLDFEFFDKTRTGDIMARMTGDLEAVRHFVAAVAYSTFENLMVFIFAIAMLFSINAKLSLALLAVAPLIAYFTLKLSGSVKPAFSEIREQFARLNTVVQENISGNRVVKAFAKEDYEIEKFMKENEEFRRKNLNASMIWAKYLPILDSLAGTLNILVILAGGFMVINETMSYGDLVTMNGFMWALNNPMRMCGWLINDIQRFAASADKIMNLMNMEPRIRNEGEPQKKDGIKGKVEFRDVSFRYEKEYVLDHINLIVEPGQTAAFIGPTGSGKSTLVSLIGRYYDCSKGQVLIDDVNIKKIDLKLLRRSVSIAMQDIFLFSDTIEGNIAYGVPDAPFEDVQRLAEVADAHGFIMNMPEGYDTIIGERGVGLSGGQKQRIALARALLKDPAILILDDTTSSVDVETEQEIHQALRKFYSSKTTFIIAHRISSVKNADRIFVLDRGRIVESGTHDELLAQKGQYYNVYVNQLGDFDREEERVG